MKKEYVLWGNPPGHDVTYGKALLVTGLKSQARADDVKTLLERDHGVTDISVQVIDGTLPSFGANVLA